MSSTFISAGERSADLGVYDGRLRREAAESPTAAVPAREKRRSGRGRLAQALTLSLALVTLAACGSLVAIVILASGSARPTDWGQVNWGLVAGRYQSCKGEPQSRGPLGCLASIGPRAGHSATPQQRGVVYVTAPITAPAQTTQGAPPARSSVAPGSGAPTAAPNQAAAPAAPPPAPAPSGDDGGGGGDD